MMHELISPPGQPLNIPSSTKVHHIDVKDGCIHAYVTNVSDAPFRPVLREDPLNRPGLRTATNRELGLKEIEAELDQATVKHGPMHSAYEAYAVILEEVRELEREVFAQVKNRTQLRTEAAQVAAMAWRVLIDVL